MFGFDPLHLMIMAPVMAFSFWAQWKVKSSYEHYSRVGTSSGLTGAEVARLILQEKGISGVKVEETSGWLSDHYSPVERVLRLSAGVYRANSAAAVGIAAHEAGHAVQHAHGMAVMQMWLALAKPAAFASNAAIWLIMGGMLLGLLGLAEIGFWLFGVAVLFQIVTLPLEFDASSKAKRFLREYGVVGPSESGGVAAVLNSAALTYVAAAAASLAQMLYFAIRLGILGGRRD